MEANEAKCSSEQIAKIALFYNVDLAQLQPHKGASHELEQPYKEKKFLGITMRGLIRLAVLCVLVPSTWEATRAFCVEFKASEDAIVAAPRLAALAM